HAASSCVRLSNSPGCFLRYRGLTRRVRRAIVFASGVLRCGRIPRGHQVDLECLDPTARPENEADDPHVLVPTEALVVALTKTVNVDRDGRAAGGRGQRQGLG